LVASSFQRRLGEILLMLVADIRRRSSAGNICLAGGLFYNTYFNTLVHEAGIFEGVFVPPNPGNAGLAAGSALAAGGEQLDLAARAEVSPFLGPGYSPEEIKATLDNCKMSYEFLHERALIETTVDALTRGLMVGWFQGRMEWGPRALGNRSILASPLSPYVLDNLNVFLKQRERYRAYGLSVREEDRPQFFAGPARARYMEYDYELVTPEPFRHVVPRGVTTVRVQTVGDTPHLFRCLHDRFAEATGVGVLVNTSFNGFNEPIVCSPRDAIRVFFGTGLDLAVLGRFVIRK
jgi:carbamoyltransferase